MNIDKEYLQGLVVDESKVIADIEKTHITNYRNLASYIEEAIDKSLNSEDGSCNYFSLYKSCSTLIKTIDNLVNTYSQKVLVVQNRNMFIEHLIGNLAEDPEQLKKTEGED